MSDIKAQFSVLQETADPAVADAIVELIGNGKDHELNRINALDFSKATGLDEESAPQVFQHREAAPPADRAIRRRPCQFDHRQGLRIRFNSAGIRSGRPIYRA